MSFSKSLKDVRHRSTSAKPGGKREKGCGSRHVVTVTWALVASIKTRTRRPLEQEMETKEHKKRNMLAKE